MANPSPDWTDIVVKLTPAVFALVIGTVGAFIAFLQYKLNRDKLRLDLFERRLAAYESLQAYFSAILRDGEVKRETLSLLWAARMKCRFLFGEEIEEYFKVLWAKAAEMHTLQNKLYSSTGGGLPVGPERSAVADKHGDLLTWKSDEMMTVDQRFAKYLRFAI